MPWYAIDTDLEGNDKFHAFVTRRGWSTDRGLAFFYRFWRTVRRHAPRGVITHWTDAYLGAQIGLARPSGILADLTELRFVDRVGNELVVHEWLERNGKWIKDTRWSKGGSETEAPPNRNDLPGNVRPRKADRPPFSGGPSAPSRARAEQEQSRSRAEQEPESRSIEPASQHQTPVPVPEEPPLAGSARKRSHPEPDPESDPRMRQVLDQLQAQYPDQDVDLTWAKVIARHREKPFTGDLEFVLRAWVAQAHTLGTERRANPEASAERSAEVLDRLEQDRQRADADRIAHPGGAAQALGQVQQLIDGTTLAMPTTRTRGP